MDSIEVKLNSIVLIIWNIFCSYNWIRYWNELMKELVSGTVSALLYLSFIFTFMLPISWFFKNEKSIPFIPSMQNSNILSAVKIWLLIGCCRLALVTSRFTVPPIPSHGDFPWLVAKKFHSHFTPKSLLWRHKFKKFLQFLYWPAHPSEK